MAGIYCQDPQFAHEMHYPGEMRINMNKGGSHRPAQTARAHHHTELRDKIIEHTMRTERHDKTAMNVNTHYAQGIIGNHPMHQEQPVSTHSKVVHESPRKARPKGEHKGGL